MSNITLKSSTPNRLNTKRWHARSAIWCSVLLLSGYLLGCGKGGTASNPSSSTNATDAKAGAESDSKPKEEGTTKPKFAPVQLGGGTSQSAGSSSSSLSEKQQMESVVVAMKPLQVMLGKWRGTTNKEFKGFKKVDELEWIWDFRTSRSQPALVVKSDKSPYISEGRLTFLPMDQKFQFTAKTPEGVQHVMTGTFESEPEEFTGDDNKTQRKFKLKMTEAEPTGDEAWQVAFNQQENNRYLVQVSRKRGTGSFQLVDTVGTQRIGTSVAANDEDYGERKCIISGGLGTSTVSYEGKTYWVCCSGCQAAFNDDPKRWLAKMQEADKMKKP